MTIAIEMVLPERRRDRIREGATRVYEYRTPSGEIKEFAHAHAYFVDEELARELVKIGYAKYLARGPLIEDPEG
jgi:hypothetical protein